MFFLKMAAAMPPSLLHLGKLDSSSEWPASFPLF